MTEESARDEDAEEKASFDATGESLVKFGALMDAMSTSPSRRRRHSLFDDDDDANERLSSLIPPPPPPHTPPARVSDSIKPAEVEVEKEPDFVSLRSPSGVSPSAGGRKRISSLSRTHLPNFKKLPSLDIFEPQESEDVKEEDEVVASICDNDGRNRSVSNTSSFSDRPGLTSVGSNCHDTLSHPPSYSRVLSKRLEVFVHWVLQIPTFRHIIDPFVKKFRNKILEWEMDR
jgi:hypothetical protein